MSRSDIESRKDEILILISLNESKASICRHLRCRPMTLDRYLDKWGIEYPGNRGAKNKKRDPKRLDAIDLAKKPYVSSHKLKIRLIEDGYKEHKCEVCGNSTWNGRRIPIELHHLDGDRFNNNLSNLEIHCCNCHAQTDSYCRKK